MSSATVPAAAPPKISSTLARSSTTASIGEFESAAPAGGPAITGRMSNNGWGSCASCHPFRLSDNVVWIFGPAPAAPSPNMPTSPPATPETLRALNWSAIFDEEEDFELNIRGASGGLGLIIGADGVTQEPTVAAFTPANGEHRQLKVRGQNAWDAIKEYIAKGIRTPIWPVSRPILTSCAAARCLSRTVARTAMAARSGPAHPRVRQAAPPDASLLTAGQLLTELRPGNTFNANAFNEIRATAVAPLGAGGFNPPTLLGLHAFPQTFFHNGSVNSLEAVMDNVQHRSDGNGGVDGLQSAAQRAQLIKFLLSIDGTTVPIAPPAPGALKTISAASYAARAVARL